MEFVNSLHESKTHPKPEDHHYISQFYLRMFSCNPKASKGKQEIFYLTKREFDKYLPTF